MTFDVKNSTLMPELHRALLDLSLFLTANLLKLMKLSCLCRTESWTS